MYDIFVFENDIPTIIFSCHGFRREEDLVTFYSEDGTIMTKMFYKKVEDKGDNAFWYWI